MDGFVRFGFADGDVSQFENAWSAGVVWNAPIAGRDDGQLGFAVSQARNSDAYEQSTGFTVESSETQFELTYADKWMPWLTIQPDLQYTRNPGTDPALGNAWTGGVRFELSL